ncbi:hypothetical protein [Leminorella grimontii]|uniref:hypothetical protein n=1 Tax=Leminorella grimontii TaxID=82981 RepID=UPI0032206E96
MDSISAFIRGEQNRHKELMVFDWVLAAQLIKEKKPSIVSAGLSGDWEYTGGEIYRNGKPVPEDETYTYLSSTWATPEIDIDGEIQLCFKMASELPNWGADTYWPPEALEIINSVVS